MEFYHYFPSVAFVVLSVDQFVGRDDGPLEQQKQCRYKRYRNRCHSLNAQSLIMVRIGVRKNKRSCGCDKI